MTPSQIYQQRREQYNLKKDSRQRQILEHFDRLHHELTVKKAKPKRWWQTLFGRKQLNPTRGIYLWGDVGRGKTMLMDIFYESLPHKRKKRFHFHQFMQLVHRDLKGLRSIQRPLTIIAGRVAREADTLCLDEFLVNDITDAMLLAGLLESLFDYGVCLVTTSNRQPDDLYKNGLQRARFLPAIDLLKKNTRILNLDSKLDYRLAALRKEGTYHYPLTDEVENRMRQSFAILSSHEQWNAQSLTVNGRKINIISEAEGVVWFDFKALCNSPLSQNDYLEIAKSHHSILVSNVPALTSEDDNAAKRFLNLLDVAYDHRIKLIISAATPIENIYTGKRLTFDFRRATSRLIEMQSEKYLGQSRKD